MQYWQVQKCVWGLCQQVHVHVVSTIVGHYSVGESRRVLVKVLASGHVQVKVLPTTIAKTAHLRNP